MDTESRRMVRAGDKRLLNWPWSSLPQHKTAGHTGVRVSKAGRRPYRYKRNKCMHEHEPEWYRVRI